MLCHSVRLRLSKEKVNTMLRREGGQRGLSDITYINMCVVMETDFRSRDFMSSVSS